MRNPRLPTGGRLGFDVIAALERGLAHNDALRAVGGRPDCERDRTSWIDPRAPRCRLCQTPEPVSGPPTSWVVYDLTDPASVPPKPFHGPGWPGLYCPGCAPFRKGGGDA